MMWGAATWQGIHQLHHNQPTTWTVQTTTGSLSTRQLHAVGPHLISNSVVMTVHNTWAATRGRFHTEGVALAQSKLTNSNRATHNASSVLATGHVTLLVGGPASLMPTAVCAKAL
jgi:hypothetical protein